MDIWIYRFVSVLRNTYLKKQLLKEYILLLINIDYILIFMDNNMVLSKKSLKIIKKIRD